MANSKPGEEVEKRPRRVLERVAAELLEKGRQVTTLSAELFSSLSIRGETSQSGTLATTAEKEQMTWPLPKGQQMRV